MMIRSYIVAYTDATGKLDTQVMTAFPPGTAEQMDADNIGGLRWMEVESDLSAAEVMHRCRIVDGALVERPALDLPETLTLAVGASATLAVPIGATIQIDGDDAGTCDDGTLEIDGDLPHVYRLSVLAWPYIDHTITVTVTEA